MRSVRSRTFRPKGTKRIIFGEVGKVDIAYSGELPFEHRGASTGRLYVWRGARPRWVDKRDLPKLIQAAGLDNLAGPEIDAYKERKSERARKRISESAKERIGESAKERISERTGGEE